MLLQHFNPTVVKADPELPPELIVVVDTEEEFDWDKPANRESIGVAAMQDIHKVQNILNEYDLVPNYVVDYPIATQPDGFEPLRSIAEKGQCEIGAHLHPWVNPPFDEPLNPSNTYPGNLEPTLERAKLVNLTTAIQGNIGHRPTTYKAGRYGIGPRTPGLLRDLGFDIDLSVCPPVDYRGDGGPDFRAFSAEPFWFANSEGDAALLEIPVTGAFVGWGGAAMGNIYDIAAKLPSFFRAHGVLSRTAFVDRLMLSPEGFTTEEHIRLTKSLYDQGLRTFTWSFHSPSVQPGCTSYVQTRADLQEFLDRFKRFFDFFFGKMSGVATTPTRIRAKLENVQ